MKKLTITLAALLFSSFAFASFKVNPMYVDMSKGKRAQSITLRNTGSKKEYIKAKVYMLVRKSAEDFSYEEIKNPKKAGLLISPTKFAIKPGKNRKMKVTRLGKAPEKDKLFEVELEPMTAEMEKLKSGDSSVGVAVKVAYGVMVVVRSKNPKADLKATRSGKVLTLKNSGNTTAILSDVKQCKGKDDCEKLSPLSIYPDSIKKVELHNNNPVTFKYSYPGHNEVMTIK